MTALAAVAILACAGVLLWRRAHERRLLLHLEAMLDAAMDGRFRESDYDERQLSSLENRLARYLASGSSARRQIEAERNQLNALVTDISHQTRTPLANIQLYSQLLAEEPLTAQGAECTRQLAAQADKLEDLINALVKTSRLETGILALHPTPGEMAEVARCAVRQYADAAARKHVHLTFAASEGRAVFDAKWTEEALCNLLDNAIKYTPAGGRVTVSLVVYELFAAFVVADSGPGIAEADQARIFARFERLAQHAQAPGVGIGLYLVRQIATSQGGYVRLESAPGEGARFALFVPRG
ncbi:MAG: HAMP domain-containing sensor histidine kinase [Peptococcaceae bacterium]|nr:HAMP domain-containing sensor histidine kinase [Peptococcaceae bacterium]